MPKLEFSTAALTAAVTFDIKSTPGLGVTVNFDVKSTSTSVAATATSHVKSTPASASAAEVDAAAQLTHALTENIDPRFVSKVEQLIVKIRSQTEVAFVKFFSAYFQVLVNEYQFDLAKDDLTKKVFSIEEQRKINIEVNELRKGLVIVFSSNPAMLHAFDYARDKIFQQNNIGYVRGVKLSDEKSVAKTAIKIPYSWKKEGDFSNYRPAFDVHRTVKYTNSDKSCAIKEISISNQDNTKLFVSINNAFFQNYRQAVSGSIFDLPSALDQACSYHSLTIIDEDYLRQILNFLAMFDQSVSVIVDEIISSVRPCIMKQAKFVNWVLERDLYTLRGARYVVYLCSKTDAVFKKITLSELPEHYVLRVYISKGQYQDVVSKLIAGGFPERLCDRSIDVCELIITDAQVLSGFLKKLAAFDQGILEIHDHVVCSYDPSNFQSQKIAFLMGLHSRLGQASAVRTGLASSPLFDKNAIGELFSFLDPIQKQKKSKNVKQDPVLRATMISVLDAFWSTQFNQVYVEPNSSSPAASLKP